MSTPSAPSQAPALDLRDFALNIPCAVIPPMTDGLEAARRRFAKQQAKASCPFSADFSVNLPREILEQIFDDLHAALLPKPFVEANHYVAEVEAVNRISTLSKDWRVFGQEKLFRKISWMEPSPESPWGDAVRLRIKNQPNIANLVRTVHLTSTSTLLGGFLVDFASHCPRIVKLRIIGLEWSNVTSALRGLENAVFTSLTELVIWSLHNDDQPLFRSDLTNPPNPLACLLNFPRLTILHAEGALVVYPCDTPPLDSKTKLPLKVLHLEPNFFDAYPYNHSFPNTNTFISRFIARDRLRDVTVWANPKELELVEWLKQPGFSLVSLRLKTWGLPVREVYKHVVELLPFHSDLEELTLEVGDDEVTQREVLFGPDDLAHLSPFLSVLPLTLKKLHFPLHLACRPPQRLPPPVFEFLASRLAGKQVLESVQWEGNDVENGAGFGAINRVSLGARTGWGKEGSPVAGSSEYSVVFADGLWVDEDAA
ncbi:hypothetical protein JCM6882_000929 [Rhodosporidiobolus microsporus]